MGFNSGFKGLMCLGNERVHTLFQIFIISPPALFWQSLKYCPINYIAYICHIATLFASLKDKHE